MIGRAGLDHKHEVNFGGSAHIKYGLQVGLIGHFYSAPPTSLVLDSAVLPGGAGNIFQSDLNGDGTSGDLLPSSVPGDYMHRIKPNNIAQYISQFNGQYANRLTPAGQVLVTNGLFTTSQMVALKGAIRPIANPASYRSYANPDFRALDVNASYPIRLARFREGMSLEPAIAFYNVGNFSNFGTLNGSLTNVDDGSIDSNNTNQNLSSLTGPNRYDVQNGLRTSRGSGTFNQGSPRTTEFQLKLNF